MVKRHQVRLSVDWNVIDLPRAITSGTSSTQRFYLADGTLSHIQDGTQMRIFLGDIVFKISPGSFGIESAGWEGGRLLPGTGNDKVLYYVNDHLGSVRVIKNGNGFIKQRFDYYPYGSVSRGWWGNLVRTTPKNATALAGRRLQARHPMPPPQAQTHTWTSAPASTIPAQPFG